MAFIVFAVANEHGRRSARNASVPPSGVTELPFFFFFFAIETNAIRLFFLSVKYGSSFDRAIFALPDAELKRFQRNWEKSNRK